MKSYTAARGKARFYVGAGIAALGLAAVAMPAHAQDAGSADDEEATAEETASPIVVTGSRIARPTLSSPVPLTTVTAEELTQQGDISLGDALNDLPSLRTTFSQGNSTRFIGTAGLNLLDLRGLGTARTLVLVNGKRHVTASPGDYLVDVNTIPVDLLERVDVVTGGNSAIYGSDAVAGVVNFILKRDFEGFAARGQADVALDMDQPLQPGRRRVPQQAPLQQAAAQPAEVIAQHRVALLCRPLGKTQFQVALRHPAPAAGSTQQQRAQAPAQRRLHAQRQPVQCPQQGDGQACEPALHQAAASARGPL